MKKHSDVITSAEFIDEQVYQVALRGGYKREFNQVSERIDALKGFTNPAEFMKADYAFRPASGLVLMLAM